MWPANCRPSPPLPHLVECVEDHLFGVGRIPDDPAGQTVDKRRVTIVQAGQSRHVPLADAAYQLA